MMFGVCHLNFWVDNQILGCCFVISVKCYAIPIFCHHISPWNPQVNWFVVSFSFLIPFISM
jgi:hypothetical protein